MRGQRGRPSRFSWSLGRTLAVLLQLAPAALGAEAAPAASGAPPSVGLTWVGPGPELACLGEEGLVTAVNDYLGRDAFAAGSVEYVLAVNVERLPDRLWRAVLEFRDASGRVLGARELKSSTDLCADLNEPLVLAVALMVDSEPELPPEPPPTPPPEPEPEPPELEESPPPKQATPLEVFGEASVALEAGLLPAVRPGLMLGAELRAMSWLSARLSAVGFWPASQEISGDASARFALTGGLLELCPGFGDKTSFRLSLCGGAFLGALGVKTDGLDGKRRDWRPLLAAAFGPKVAIPLGRRWFMIGGFSGVVPYRPDRFVYQADGVTEELFQCSSLSLLANVGASVIF